MYQNKVASFLRNLEIKGQMTKIRFNILATILSTYE